MRKANYSERAKVCSILEKAFADVPGVRWIADRNTEGGEKKYRKLIEIAVEMTFAQGEVYFSDNEKGVLLFFRQHQRVLSAKVFWLYLKMAVQVIGLRRLPEILNRERYIKHIRPPQNEQYIYVWFIGAETDNEKSAIIDLKNGIFNLSLHENLPIYMETTVPKAKVAYMRYGFEVFHEWYNRQREITVWFFRRSPSDFGITP